MEQTLLSAAVVVDLTRHGQSYSQSQNQIKVKGSGQECLLHTTLFRSWMRLVVNL